MNSNRKKILLAVDGSDQSLKAVRYVSKILPSTNLELILFNTFSKIPESLYDLAKEPQYDQRIAKAEELEQCQKILIDSINKFMDETRQILIEAGFPDEAITIDSHERKEGIARDIITESMNGYSAVVVGRSGLSKFKDFVLGSVASKLINTLTHISICLVGGDPAPGKILLAADESDGAMRAVNFVGGMFGNSAFQVTLLHVVRGFNIFEQRYENLLDVKQDEKWMEVGKNEMVFDKARTRLMKAGLDPKLLTTKLITGVSSRAAAIIQEAKEGGYGTIVVGRRGLSEVKEFSMGRVSRKVVELGRKHAIWVVS